MLIWPGPLPVYIVGSSSFHLLPGQGCVLLFPVNSHLLGWETKDPAAGTNLSSGFSWETTTLGLEGAGSHVPSPAGTVVPCEQPPRLKFFPFIEIPLKKKQTTTPHQNQQICVRLRLQRFGRLTACLAFERPLEVCQCQLKKKKNIKK